MKKEQTFTIYLGKSPGLFVLSGGLQVFQFQPDPDKKVTLDIKITQEIKDN